ncbi:GNAT family N-acetyltransferase [Amycolatopsis rhizosphaerae]|uniref:GNAT family N-acetyltransferase n=1 Tax=Amycolatopsis rhizosphaerae TaxID=2053003 RepID=A0A558B6E1_9PSEU|nr:GNAT family N-acetyltransferase [Amycolatopsis rhizosphaerae]TVT32063.1 GNAT family N-acetyltransferase [Amycolatopsis rhizosphaerae]
MGIFLETGRLVLRAFTEADADRVTELDSDPEVMRHLTGGKPTPREVVVREVLPKLRAGGYWAAQLKATGEFLGWFEFRPCPAGTELGYRLRRAAWGQGYATEGARALIDKGFAEPGVERVVAYTMTVNTPSRRVMEKAGLGFVRTFHQHWPEAIDGSEHGDVEYALDRRDWRRRQVEAVRLEA